MDFHHRLFSETLCKDDKEVDTDIQRFKTNDLHFYRLHGNMDPKVFLFLVFLISFDI